MKLTDHKAHFVETVGRFWENSTGSRTAGRIIGWLMICEPDHQSAQQLVETLDVSTGSVSTQIRQLERIGLVERVTFPGERVSYYRFPDRAWSKLIEAELGRLVELRKLSEAGAGVLPAVRAERVTELGLIADFFVDEWPGLVERLNVRLSEEES